MFSILLIARNNDRFMKHCDCSVFMEGNIKYYITISFLSNEEFEAFKSLHLKCFIGSKYYNINWRLKISQTVIYFLNTTAFQEIKIWNDIDQNKF